MVESGFRSLHLSNGSIRNPSSEQTNLRGQTEHFRRFSLIFADSRLFLESKAFGKHRFSQKTADFRRKPQEPAENRRLAFVPLRFVPLSAALKNFTLRETRNLILDDVRLRAIKPWILSFSESSF